MTITTILSKNQSGYINLILSSSTLSYLSPIPSYVQPNFDKINPSGIVSSAQDKNLSFSTGKLKETGIVSSAQDKNLSFSTGKLKETGIVSSAQDKNLSFSTGTLKETGIVSSYQKKDKSLIIAIFISYKYNSLNTIFYNKSLTGIYFYPESKISYNKSIIIKYPLQKI